MTRFSFSEPTTAGKFQLAARVIRSVGREMAMKRSKFTQAQIDFSLPQADEGAVIGEVCRRAEIGEANLYN
jgi:hypothetical protein